MHTNTPPALAVPAYKRTLMGRTARYLEDGGDALAGVEVVTVGGTSEDDAVEAAPEEARQDGEAEAVSPSDSEPAAGVDAPQDAEPSSEGEDSDVDPADDPSDSVPLEELPASWQKSVRDLRRDNAAKRTQIRELKAELASAQSDSEKVKILSARNLDPKFLPMISGADAAAWEQAADLLVELRGHRGITPDPVQVAVSNPTTTKTAREQRADAFFAGLNG